MGHRDVGSGSAAAVPLFHCIPHLYNRIPQDPAPSQQERVSFPTSGNCALSPPHPSNSSAESLDRLYPAVGSTKPPRKRTTSQCKSEPPLLRTSKRTIYTAGRPPWYNEHGTQSKEAFVIGRPPPHCPGSIGATCPMALQEILVGFLPHHLLGNLKLAPAWTGAGGGPWLVLC